MSSFHIRLIEIHCRYPSKDNGKTLSEPKESATHYEPRSEERMKGAALILKGTAGEVKDSPREKSETLFSHWRTDSNSQGCQSILIKLPWSFKWSILKSEWHKSERLQGSHDGGLFSIRSARYFIVFGVLLERIANMRTDGARNEVSSARSLARCIMERCARGDEE